MKFRWPFVLRRTHDRALQAASIQRQRDLSDAVNAIERVVLNERARCLSIAERALPSARGEIVKRRIADGIRDAPAPRASHPDLPPAAPSTSSSSGSGQ